MKTVYWRDAEGRRVETEVREEVAKAMEESRREAWRVEAKRRYYGLSLENLRETGFPFRGEPGPEELLIERERRREERTSLRNSLSRLTAEQKTVIKLLYFEGLSLRETAARLGISYQAVQRRRDRILQKLKILYEKGLYFDSNFSVKCRAETRTRRGRHKRAVSNFKRQGS